MQRMGKALNRVRIAEVKQLHEDGYEPVLKGARWLLLKRPENQTTKEATKLKTILQYNLKSARGHLLKEDFQQFWEYTSPAWAGKFLDQWCTRAMRSRLDPMKEVGDLGSGQGDLCLGTGFKWNLSDQFCVSLPR